MKAQNANARTWSFLSILALGISLLQSAACQDKSNGFNSNIQWLNPEDMKTFDYSANGKPILQLFNQPFCESCKHLKTEVHGPLEGELVQLSTKLVMVNIGGKDTELYGNEFSPDGDYIPRIILSSPNGTLRTDLRSPLPHNPKFAYFYYTAPEVKAAMEVAIRELTAPQAAQEEEEPQPVQEYDEL